LQTYRCQGETENTLKALLRLRLQKLISISVSRTAELIIHWYSDELKTTIKDIADEQLKLRFLQWVISNTKQGIEYVMDYFELKCKLEQISSLYALEDSVYYALKTDEKNIFPLDMSLKVCKKYQIKEATAFLIEKKGNNIQEALALYIDVMRAKLRSFISKEQEDLITTNQKLFEEFRNCCIRLCKVSVDKDAHNNYVLDLLESLVYFAY
jgi:hypothetical protein